MIADKTPEGMNKIYFCGSGSEANDTVVRLARHYWAARGNKSKSIITDLDGFVDLSLFSSDENIYFQLLGYSTLKILKTIIAVR